MLIVLGKGGRYIKKCGKANKRKESFAYKWRLQCDCGKIIELYRNDFDKNSTNKGHPQISCGCKRNRGLVDNKQRPVDIAGKRWGTLVAIRLSGRRDKPNQPTWLMQCDCGLVVERSHKNLNNCAKRGYRVNCGCTTNHPEIWLRYPPTPNPYPTAAGELLKKYLPLTELSYKKIKSEVEDEKRDRLIRLAWTITYRRSQGEIISEEYEQRLIKKTLRYASIEVKHRNYLLTNIGRVIYNTKRINKEIGREMTNVTSKNYPEIQVSGESLLPIKRLKFKRC